MFFIVDGGCARLALRLSRLVNYSRIRISYPYAEDWCVCFPFIAGAREISTVSKHFCIRQASRNAILSLQILTV
jgi:hypothetical protein